ncbi:ABC transporter permease [Faecalimicrobium sp. JNUCC 81]
MRKAIYLAIQYMKKQKGRTFSLIIGISLAVMLVFSLNVVPETKSKIETERAYKTYGDYHVEYSNLDKDIVEKLRDEKGIRDMYEIVNLGSIVDKNGITMALDSSNKDFIKEIGYKLEKGRLPQNENEIILESKALEKMGVDEKLNQNINFNIQKEYKEKDGENKIFAKNNSFKLVGIISKPKDYYEEYEDHILKAFAYYQEGKDNFIPLDLVKYGGTLSFSTKAPQMSKIEGVIGKYGLSQMNFMGNAGLIQTLNSFEMQGTTKFEANNKLLPMFTAVLVIYNIFNMVLVDMTKQLGTLKAIGASKKHIRIIILTQSLLVLVLGTLIGILLGIILSYIGLAMIYKGIIGLYISKNSLLQPITMATITVLIASIVPIYKSGKISPIEAIRSSDKTSSKQKNRFYYKFIRKVFGVSGERAYKNLWRNKIRTILSILAISLGGSLYIKMMALYNDDYSYDNTAWSIMSMGDIDINLTHNRFNVNNSYAGYSSKYIDEVSKIKDVKSVEASTSIYGYLKPEFSNLDNEYIKNQGISKEDKVLETDLWMQGYDEKTLKGFDKYIEKGSTDLNKDKSKYPNVLVYNHFYNGDNKNKILKDLNIGDLLTTKIPAIENGKEVYKDMTVRVAGFINRKWGKEREIGNFSAMQVAISQDELWQFTGRNTYNKISMKIEKGSDVAVHKKLEKVIKNEPYGEIESKYKYKQFFEKQEVENKRVVLLVVSLILVISSLNILCTIKTNLIMRIKEFATLRAIGMSMKKLKRMIMIESIMYGLLGGIIASVYATYDQYKYVKIVNEIVASGFGTQNVQAFKIPIIEILQYISVCVLICVLAVLLVRKKIEELSIVEGLRNDE